MATSKKEPPYPSRDRATRMSPNLRPSSSESSSRYGARRARSVPSSPDRKFGPSAAVPASASPDMCRPSLSLAGRSISSRTMSSSGSSVDGSKPLPGVASKPMLARPKSVKATATSQQPPALAVPSSNSFKDVAKTVTASNSPSTLLKSKLSPRPCALPISLARAQGAAAKKRVESANGGASTSSRARSVPQRAMKPSASIKEKEEEPSMQFEESETLSTPSIEDHLHEQLPDPVNLKSIDMAASGSARRDRQEPYSEQHCKNEEEVKEQLEKENTGGSKLHNGVQDADTSGKNKPDIVKAADESERVEKEDAKAKAVPLMNRTEVAQSWRKDDPKSNDVIEETKSKLLEERKSRVKALVGAFETVMSFKE